MGRTAALALLSHWRRHPGQALTLVLGLALATALWTGVQAINTEARASYDRAAGALQHSGLALLVPRSGQTLGVAEYVALRRAGWPVAPVIEGTLRLAGRSFTLIGLDPLSAPALPAATAPTTQDPGRALLQFITPPGELRAHPDTIARIGAGALAARLVPSADLSPGTLVGDIGIVAELLGTPERLSRLLLLHEPAPRLPPLAQIAPGLIQTPPQEAADMRGLTGSFHLNLTAFGFLSFAVGLFIVHGAIGLAFEQRRPMVRTLRALGVPLRLLMLLLLGEALAVALIAGGLGVVLGYALASALLPDVAATLRGLYGAPVAGSVSLRPEWWAAGLAMAMFGTLLATAQSLHALARMPLLAPANPRAWAVASARSQRVLAAGGLACLIVAGATTVWGHGLIAGFVALGGLLLGAALLLPTLLSAGLALAIARARRPVAQWFWADARQQVPGLSLALMALLLALAANIGVSTMVASFRTTFEGWLDQRLAAEMYLRFETPAQAAPALRWLASQTDAILPIVSHEDQLDGLPGQVYGMMDHPTYRDHWPLIATPARAWDGLHHGAGVLINEQWANRGRITPGDRVHIAGRDWPVLGIYSDYGNPRPQAILGLSSFRDLFPDVAETRFALRADPAGISGLSDTLQTRFGLRPDQITDQTSLKASSREVFERTFAATDALNVLTLAVAGFAILTSLLTLQSLRLPQVAPLWALGLTRRRIAVLDLARSGMLALATAVLALPTGLALAWLLLAVVNVEAFGWRLPLRLFPGDWAWLCGAALLAALLAAALPALRLARQRPADLLRIFANAR